MRFLVIASALAALSSGCALDPVARAPLPAPPERFEAALPHHGGVSDLLDWWSQFDDPLMAQLVQSAQASSPSLQQALLRITQARASATSARSSLFPALDGSGSFTRNKTASAPGVDPITTNGALDADASWEIDLFGARRKALEAASLRLSARDADWHEARVSLAAEVATTYVRYRACVLVAGILTRDLESRVQTAQLTTLRIKTGMTSSADGTLIDASASDARQRLIAQQLECDVAVKALVALTGIAEPDLRARLGEGTAPRAALPQPQGIAVASVPAQVLAQRPDIAAAERELAAAHADIGVAQANRYPRLSLLGSIGIGRLRVGGANYDETTWSFGPALTLPLFDAGRRKADVVAAQARADEALTVYRQRVREAVREIEEGLARLDAASRRETHAGAAARDYERFFALSDALYQAGGRSMLDLEEARRTALSAKQNEINVQLDRVTAWIALYKAMGGGWTRAVPPQHSSAKVAHESTKR